MTFAIRLLAYLVFWVVAMVLAPFLPAFSVMRDGPADNNHRRGIEPRLPVWLAWFDTSTDNSLWGDLGWRTEHCPNHWDSYPGMVCWLWRNAACGFSWSVLAHTVTADETFSAWLVNSGGTLYFDKSRRQQGWFKITSSRGAWQFRWIKEWLGWQWSFESGWLLDVYVLDRNAIDRQPKAIFMFQPSARRIKP